MKYEYYLPIKLPDGTHKKGLNQRALDDEDNEITVGYLPELTAEQEEIRNNLLADEE